MPAASTVKIGLALSGGGVRAAIFHIGVLEYLAECGLLEQIEHISTVSGGTLLAGLVYHCNNYTWPSSQEYQSHVMPGLEKYFVHSSLGKNVLMQQILNPFLWKHIASRANTVAYTIRKCWRIDGTLQQIPKWPRWSINATTHETGKNWRFDQWRMGDYQAGYVEKPDFHIADMMAISAAVPWLIGPYRLSTYGYHWKRYKSWDNYEMESAQAIDDVLHLADGGLYDNLGTEPLFQSFPTQLKPSLNYLIVSDASTPIGYKPFPSMLHIFSRLLRAVRIMHAQVRSLRVRMLANELLDRRDLGLLIQSGRDAAYLIEKARRMGVAAERLGFERQFLSAKDAAAAQHYPTTLFKVKQEDYQLIKRHGYETALLHCRLNSHLNTSQASLAKVSQSDKLIRS